MKGKKQTSEAEIERQLIADADNSDAWEEPIAVPARTSPRPHWHAGAKRISRANQKAARNRKDSGKRSISANNSRAA